MATIILLVILVIFLLNYCIEFEINLRAKVKKMYSFHYTKIVQWVEMIVKFW